MRRLLLLSSLLIVACPADSQEIPSPTDPSAIRADAAVPRPANARNPLTEASPIEPNETSFQGTVVEALPAGNYTYFEVLHDDDQRTWIATMDPVMSIGTPVLVTAFSSANNFQSRRLNRRFDRLLFATIRLSSDSRT